MLRLLGSKRAGAVVASVSLSLVLLANTNVQGLVAAPAPAVPDYEVKLFMKPDAVLDSSKELKSSVRSTFGMPSSKTKMSVQYMDTASLELDAQGWNVRVRKMEEYSDKEFELTYKKRYPIVNDDIDGALAQAALDGFDATEDDYEAQVDWGYTKKTLSFSNKKLVTKSGYNGMDLPSKSDSRSMTISNAPGKFENDVYSNWGTDKLAVADKYGPVDAKRWIGTWQGKKLYIEVWPIIEADGTGYDYIVESSFKTTSRSEAAWLQSELQTLLTQKGWFSPTDELKTQMILQRY
ncbi:hypothetical protein [Paenibacillus sp. YYML68]|uniref:hypothetical protein n=1 Tax=Paenibacillus sp. YYML68 TaxID=2909250 RepID=UPI00248FBE3F|nr:hypothetical protein [Paenibacillus sp. YYML68]